MLRSHQFLQVLILLRIISIYRRTDDTDDSAFCFQSCLGDYRIYASRKSIDDGEVMPDECSSNAMRRMLATLARMTSANDRNAS